MVIEMQTAPLFSACSHYVAMSIVTGEGELPGRGWVFLLVPGPSSGRNTCPLPLSDVTSRGVLLGRGMGQELLGVGGWVVLSARCGFSVRGSADGLIVS